MRPGEARQGSAGRRPDLGALYASLTAHCTWAISCACGMDVVPQRKDLLESPMGEKIDMPSETPLTPLRLKVIASLLEAGRSAEEIAAELKMSRESVEIAIKAFARAEELKSSTKP